MPKALVADLYDIRGQRVGKEELPSDIFGVEVNRSLVAQAVRVYLTNQTRAVIRRKRRGDVVGSGKKIWRQKGTGRARHGHRYAPIFVGGGLAHGPVSEATKRLRMSKKMRKQAIFCVLSDKLRRKKLALIKDLGEIDVKTKKAEVAIRNIVSQIDDKFRSIGILYYKDSKKLFRGCGNIDYIMFLNVDSLSVYNLLRPDVLLLSQSGLSRLKDVFGAASSK